LLRRVGAIEISRRVTDTAVENNALFGLFRRGGTIGERRGIDKNT